MIDFNKIRSHNELYRLSEDTSSVEHSSTRDSNRIRKESVSLAAPLQTLSSESLSHERIQSLRTEGLLAMGRHRINCLWSDKNICQRLTINGENIQLDKEGRFRLHVAQWDVPVYVQAISSDGLSTGV